MQVIFTDNHGRRQVLNARDAAAVAHLVTAKHADGWALAPENPPIVHQAANDVAFATSGEFLDPRGFTMTLRASTPADFRILVTRKLAAGWKRIPKSPPVAPLKNESVVAIGPPEPEKPPAIVLPAPPSAEEREAAIAAVRRPFDDVIVEGDTFTGKAAAALKDSKV